MMPLGMRGVPTPGRLSRKGREGVPGMVPRALAAVTAVLAGCCVGSGSVAVTPRVMPPAEDPAEEAGGIPVEPHPAGPCA